MFQILTNQNVWFHYDEKSISFRFMKGSECIPYPQKTGDYGYKLRSFLERKVMLTRTCNCYASINHFKTTINFPVFQIRSEILGCVSRSLRLFHVCTFFCPFLFTSIFVRLPIMYTTTKTW